MLLLPPAARFLALSATIPDVHRCATAPSPRAMAPPCLRLFGGPARECFPPGRGRRFTGWLRSFRAEPVELVLSGDRPVPQLHAIYRPDTGAFAHLAQAAAVMQPWHGIYR